MTYFFLFFILMAGGIIAWIFKNHQLRVLQTIFREYNREQNEAVLLDWIREKNTSQRLVRTLDYLYKVQDEALAVTIYSHFGAEHFPQRHIRIFACRALAGQGMKERALEMVESLRASFPGDDAILELCLEIYLRFEQYPQARALLNERMNRKYKGTIFLRFHSQLLAVEGKLEEAITVLSKVVERDRSLYQNTFSPTHKKLIYDQYVASQQLLDQFEDQRQGT